MRIGIKLRLGKVPDWVGAVRKEWEKVVALELPPHGVADISKYDLHEEEFELGDLVQDWKAQMEKQELGWGVPVELLGTEPAMKWKKDYVLLRSLLQTMATYASPVPGKDKVMPALKAGLEVKPDQMVFRMTVQSDAKSQKKTAENLKMARELAPLLGGTLNEEAGELKLTIKR